MYQGLQMKFEWDKDKDRINQHKHQISFTEAQKAFLDPNRLIALDHKHSTPQEKRYFCFGKIQDRILTVRFTLRNNQIRIIGAGYWREGRKKYEEHNRV